MKYVKQLKSDISNTSSIIGKDKYINSAVLIPIVVIDEKEYLLFEKRSQSVRQPGEVSFPGGHFNVSQDVDYLSTAIRETCEELGISENKISIIGKLGTLVAPMGVIVEAFIGTLNINFLEELEIDKQEVENVFMIALDFFIDNRPTEYFTRLELHPYRTNEKGDREELLPVKELGLPEIYSLPWISNKHRVLVYHANGEIIWGITAELIYELSKKLKAQIDKKI
jgi:8-oxo-dGTP pyrophosphatase MutT (NUDIX family)